MQGTPEPVNPLALLEDTEILITVIPAVSPVIAHGAIGDPLVGAQTFKHGRKRRHRCVTRDEVLREACGLYVTGEGSVGHVTCRTLDEASLATFLRTPF